MHEEGKNITTDIEIAEILNNRFSPIFTSENLKNVPNFNLSYRKRIEAPITYFRINEEIIKKCYINVSLSKRLGLCQLIVQAML